jgi:16S rRNA (adenine1518-N6/adenine1519-N6)-dimethyltransferase
MPALEFMIPKEAFRPIPKVDSAVIQVKIREKPAVGVRDENIFFRVVKTAFSQRRKMLSNSLKGLNPYAGKWLDRAGIDPKRRPETLSIEEFAALANSFDY